MGIHEVDTLAAAREASTRHSWTEALALYREAREHGELDADDYERLGDAAWWSGKLDESVAANERAFHQHLEVGRHEDAARIALRLAKDEFGRLAAAVGAGWLGQAERLLADRPECVVHGYLARLHAVIAFEAEGDFERASEHATTALDIAARHGDRDLQALALQDRGRVLVAAGRVKEGLALVDEATVAAVSGDLAPLTTGFVYCNTIAVCESLADYRRAGEWTEAARRWCERQAIGGFPGLCRVHRAGLMRLRGAWPEAEAEARNACAELQDFYLSHAGEGFYEIGEIRLHSGDAEGAEEAFRQAQELGREPQPGLALLRLEQGDAIGAYAALRRALAGQAAELARARLLPAFVAVALTAGKTAAAADATDELERIAGRFATPALEARAADARGAVALAAGEPAAAATQLRRACKLWHEVDAPFEGAQTRLLLAEAAAAEGDQATTVLELEAATTVFDRLGAAPAARKARALIAQLTDAAPRAARTFMFTDICRSTNLVEAIGDESWSSLLAWHDRTLRACLASHGGEEVKHVGDGFFVSFSDAGAAVACAVEIQRTLANHRREHGFAPSVRIGLHATEATQAGSDYKGKGVHEAARIGERAQANEILASQATLEGLKQTGSPAGTVELKGLREPVELVALGWR